MALPGSGPLTFQAIQDEFGSSHPISLSEYYRNGGLVPSNNGNVPTSGQISVGNFYGAVNEIGVTASSGAASYNVQTAFSAYWNVAVPKRLTINSGVTLGILTVPASMAGTLIIDNSGAVQGLGGNSAGASGATAMTIQSTGVTINLVSGSTISGGAGAGGNGGTGGQGSTQNNYYCCGCQCCPGGCSGHYNDYGHCCGNDCNNFYGGCHTNSYYSGGASGAFGRGQGYSQLQANGTAGSAGGTNAGAGGAGGNGGTFGNSGATGASGANGNSTNGSAGSAGGAAGRAITFSGVSAYTIIGTNSGTINGAYT